LRCISGYKSCFLIWDREHALSVAMSVQLDESAAAIPVSSALLMVLIIPTPPEFTLMEVLEDGMYTPAPIRWGLKEVRQMPSVYAHLRQSGTLSYR